MYVISWSYYKNLTKCIVRYQTKSIRNLKKQLNLEKAREAALAGDTATLQSEIASQLGSIEEFNRMNVIQQEAFAKSIGLSRGELAGMLDAQKGNLSTQGDLVDGQQDGLKAMMSGVSEAEKNANIERAKQEASIKFYTTLAPLVQQLQLTFAKIKETLTGLFTDLVVKPMVDWVSGPAGQAFIQSLPERAEKFAASIKVGATALGEGVAKLSNFIKEHPWLTSIAAVSTGVVVKGLSALGALRGATPLNPMYVKIAEGASSAADSVRDMFRSKTKSSKGPLTKSGKPDMRYKTNRTPTSSMRALKMGGTGLKIAKGLAGGAASLLGGLALDYATTNQMQKAQKLEQSGQLEAAKKARNIGKATDIGSSALTGAGIGGSIGALFGGVGAVPGAAIGGVLGAGYGAYKNFFADTDSKQITKPNSQYRGPKLTESDPKVIRLLEKLVSASEKGGVVMLDGQKVGQTLSTNARRLQ